MRWFTLSWWKYLFKKRNFTYGYIGMIRTIICRIKNHPCGVVWYNSLGIEPDMHCKNCGDDIG